jgi:hypothetical protein
LPFSSWDSSWLLPLTSDCHHHGWIGDEFVLCVIVVVLLDVLAGRCGCVVWAVEAMPFLPWLCLWLCRQHTRMQWVSCWPVGPSGSITHWVDACTLWISFGCVSYLLNFHYFHSLWVQFYFDW